MFHKVDILAKNNQYESKRYFSKKIAEAFARNGLEVDLHESDSGSFIEGWGNCPTARFDLACSFNRFSRQPDGLYVWEKLGSPFVSFLIDPLIYNLETVTTARALATCVDRDDLTYAKRLRKGNVIFMPHAVEKELCGDQEEKIYPVVFIGTCYDPDNLKVHWKKHLPSEQINVIEEAIKLSFSDITKGFVAATDEVLASSDLSLDSATIMRLYYYVDHYMRGYDRVELIRTIKNVEVHIFGGTCWRAEKPIVGWNRYFSTQRNVIIHPAIDYQESLQILKKSKICLNSVPTLRNGSHERVLASYACGALPISSDNLYWREEFGDSIPLYSYNQRAQVVDYINEYLHDEQKRQAVIDYGQQIVKERHTWDQRVQLLLSSLPEMIRSLS